MKTSTMTVKGQVTVPKMLRDEFGWKVASISLLQVNSGGGACLASFGVGFSVRVTAFTV